MRCEEFEIRLNEVLDQRREPGGDVSLMEHSRHCSACRVLATSYQGVLEGLRRSEPRCDPFAGPGQDLAGRVLASLEPMRVVRFPRRRKLMALAAAAAVLLLVIGPWAWFGWGRRAEEPPGTIAQPGPTSNPKPDRSGAGPTQARKSEAGTTGPGTSDDKRFQAPSSEAGPSYSALAREISTSLSVAMQPFPVGAFGLGGDVDVPRGASSATVRQPDWVSDVTDGLTPVTRPTAGVLSTFIELLSAGDEGTHL